ncbi:MULTISPECIES: hypothetical protein [unclassified Salinibacterium]|nr:MULTISPECIES: hypothetical protein [unclassified Salinibacterium]
MSEPKKPHKKVPPARVGLWFIIGIVGIYFVITGLVGILGG